MERDLTPRERKARLRSMAPADAAFVLHLVQCERCRRHAGMLLGLIAKDTAKATDEASDLFAEEQDILRRLIHAGYLLSQMGGEPQGEQPLSSHSASQLGNTALPKEAENSYGKGEAHRFLPSGRRFRLRVYKGSSVHNPC